MKEVPVASTFRDEAPAAMQEAIYTCPMHPEVRQPGPGVCPKCGMTLEPVVATLEEAENPELADMTRRFWVGVALATPVVLWAGWPFFARGWQSISSGRLAL